MNAMNLSFEGIRITPDMARRHYHEFDVVEEIDGGYGLLTKGEIASFGSPANPNGVVYISIPSCLLPDAGGDIVWPLSDYMRRPYGKDFTNRIVASVFHKDFGHYRYGIAPGRYWFDQGVFHFKVELDPSLDSADSILLYANRSMRGYAGVYNKAHFNLGDTGFYGLVLPMNDLVERGGAFVGSSVSTLRTQMTVGLADYLARASVMATVG